MLEQLKYKNHINEVYEFGKDGIYVDTNDLHDYEWSVTSKGNRIANLSRKVSKRTLPVYILCETEEQGLNARNKLLEVCEKDVLALEHGQIIIGDYYFKCFVTKSSKTDYQAHKRYMALKLTLTSDFPYWVKEKLQSFGVVEEEGGDTLTWDGNTEGKVVIDNAFYHVSDAYVHFNDYNGTWVVTYNGVEYECGVMDYADFAETLSGAFALWVEMGAAGADTVAMVIPENLLEAFEIEKAGIYLAQGVSSLTIPGYTGFGGGSSGGNGLDYPFDYDFDYAAAIASTEINNTGFVASNFKMIIYGACINPAITIAGHTYQVDCTVNEGEYLTIDSTTKKIYVTANDGTITNQFNNRNKTSYIFEKIPSGTSDVTWIGDFGFDIILMEERSEPKWT